jgi:translation initiation factor IF-3
LTKVTAPQITAKVVVLIGEDGNMLGKYLTDKAYSLASEKSLDLVRIGGTDEEPVCKILDYQKHLYAQKKKAQEQKRIQRETGTANAGKMKEVKIRVETSEHDLKTFAAKASDFISDGFKVKITVGSKGREGFNTRLLYEMYERFLSMLTEIVQHEMNPKVSGKELAAIVFKA